MFVWGWTPFVDPEQMVSYFTCDQVASDPEDPTNYYNDANWCDKEYDRLYKQQKVETDRAKRRGPRPPDAAALPRQPASTRSLYVYPDTQAYREGPLHGFVRQPAETGPVIYSNSSPTYASLAPVTATRRRRRATTAAAARAA